MLVALLATLLVSGQAAPTWERGDETKPAGPPRGAFFGLAAYVIAILLNSGWLDGLGRADTLAAVAVGVVATPGLAFGFAYPLKNYLHLAVPALAVYGLILLGIGLLMPQGVLNVRWVRRPALRPLSVPGRGSR